MKLLSIIILLSALPLIATADIYRTIDSNGITTFSDQPNAAAEAVKLPSANIVTSPVSAEKKTGNGHDKNALSKKSDYTGFSLLKPKDQETLPNPTDMTMSVAVSPELREGDTVQFFLDGQSVAPAAANTIVVIPKTRGDNVILDRGTHTAYAELLNAAGNSLEKTDSVTFYIHYQSALFPNQPTTNISNLPNLLPKNP